jgi:ribonuclease Z
MVLMKIVFLGTGEAFDEELPNSSVLILSKTNLLLDCGYSVPRVLWSFNPDESFLDAIFISHKHADHYFGIPPILVRMKQQKREKPLKIICQDGMKRIIQEIIEYGYQGFLKEMEFELDFIEVVGGQVIQLNEFELSFAPTIHSVDNLAVRVDNGKNTLCYSGDGMFNQKTEKLYGKSDLLIHEALTLDERLIDHACITDLIEMAKRNSIKCLALIHLQRTLSKKDLKEVRERFSKERANVLIPEPLDEYIFK